jgi:hypothetical protein
VISHGLQHKGHSIIRHPMRDLWSTVLCLGLSPCWVQAQDAAPQPLEIGPSGAAYLKSVGYRGIETDVVYYDPTGAVPPLETAQDPPPPPKPNGTGVVEGLSNSRIFMLSLVTGILIGLAVLVWRGAGNFTLSLQGDAQNPARARRMAAAGRAASAGPPADLRAIMETADRRRALVLLAQTALARTVTANGVLLQPSWTMRDALRHIPKGQRHLDGLRNLVMAGERVLFGNRDVTEAEFQAHLTTIGPLLSEALA